MPHSLGSIFQSRSGETQDQEQELHRRLVDGAASSTGKWPRVRTARRSLASRASMAFVVHTRRRMSS